MVGSNSSVQCPSPIEELTMQSYGFSQRCAECLDNPLELARFERAIIGSGQTFSSIEEFRDAIYLLSLVGRFRYKFRRNFACHNTILCVVEVCPWKVIARAVGETCVVQIHTFQNMHNHSLEDTSKGQPAVRAKHRAQIVDDVIRGSPDYLPCQMSEDFGIHYGINLSYAQAWNIKEKAKERIHGIPKFSYKLLP